MEDDAKIMNIMVAVENLLMWPVAGVNVKLDHNLPQVTYIHCFLYLTCLEVGITILYQAQDVLNFPINNFWGKKKKQFSTRKNVLSHEKLLSLYTCSETSPAVCIVAHVQHTIGKVSVQTCTLWKTAQRYAVPFIVQYKVLVDRAISLPTSVNKEVK